MTTIIPPIGLPPLRRHVEIVHRVCAGVVGFLTLQVSGLIDDFGRPQSLTPQRERFLVGAVGPMTNAALRLGRAGNIALGFDIRDDRDAPVRFCGFALKLARAADWTSRVPFAPTAALAAGDTLWPIFLLSEPVPAAALLPVLQSFSGFAGLGVPDAGDLEQGVPLAGSVYTPPIGAAAPVEVALDWRLPAYKLADFDVTAIPAPYVTLAAFPPEPPKLRAAPPANDDEDGADVLGVRLGRLSLLLHAQMRKLDIGSDVEIARLLARALVGNLGDVIHDEGSFWFYSIDDHCWRPLDHNLIFRVAHAFDGAIFERPTGKPDLVQLGTSRLVSILRQTEAILAQRNFFRDAAIGINCETGFIAFLENGTPELRPHDPAHRQRHTLRGHWDSWALEDPDPPPGSLLFTLLEGCFRGDDDAGSKVALIGELAGCAATGYATKLRNPKLTILKGASAGNGKSAVLDVLSSMLPPDAVASVPAAKFNDDRHVIHLVGKYLNRRDEVSSAAVISSDACKNIITGEPIAGRDVYKSAVVFRPIALHVFACNTLPSFTGGLDRGVQRRQAVLEFNRTIPSEEQIPGIGRLIAVEEPYALLAFAVAGQQRLMRQGAFTVPPSSERGLRDWFLSGDPVIA
jgi:putative DNA primase/helicase